MVTALALVVLANSGLVFCEEKLELGTLDWEPYIGEKMTNQGWVAEVVREAFKRSGITVDMAFKPWARVVAEAKKGVLSGYFPEYFAEELKQDFVLSDPFPGGPLGFFKRKGEAITYKTLKDLSSYKIGVVRGYVNTAEFDAAAYLQKDEAKDDLTNLKKLLAKRIELVVIDKYVGMHILKQDLADQADQLEFMDPPLEVKDLYVCISKQIPNYQAKIDAFNEGLKKIKADGTIAAIMKKHGF